VVALKDRFQLLCYRESVVALKDRFQLVYYRESVVALAAAAAAAAAAVSNHAPAVLQGQRGHIPGLTNVTD